MIEADAVARPLDALKRSLHAQPSQAGRARPKRKRQGGARRSARGGRKKRGARDAWRQAAVEAKSGAAFLVELVSLRGSAHLAEERASGSPAPLQLDLEQRERAQALAQEVCERLDAFDAQLQPVFLGRVDVVNLARAQRILRGQSPTATAKVRARAFANVFADFSRMHISNIVQSVTDLRLEVAPRIAGLGAAAAALEATDAALTEATSERAASLYDALVDAQSEQLVDALLTPLEQSAPPPEVLAELISDAGALGQHRVRVGLAARAVYRIEEGRLRSLVCAIAACPSPELSSSGKAS